MPSSFAPGQLVWARLEGFPPWPASVIEPTEEHLVRLGVDALESNEYVVLFFNDGDQYQKMSTSALKPYDPRKADKYYQAARKSYKTQLRGAIKQANDEYELLKEAAPSSAPPSEPPSAPSSAPSNKNKRSRQQDEADQVDDSPPAKKPRAELEESDDEPPETLVKKRRAPKKKKKRVRQSDPAKSGDSSRKKSTKPGTRPAAPASPISKPTRRRSRISKKLESDDELASLPPSPRPTSPPLEENKPPAHPQHAVKKVPEHVRKTIEAAHTASPTPSTPEKDDVKDEDPGSGDDVYVTKPPSVTPEKPHPPYAGKRPHPMPPKGDDVDEDAEEDDLEITPVSAKKDKRTAKQEKRPSSPIPRKAHGKIKKKKRTSKASDSLSSRKSKSARDDDLVIKKERRRDRLSKTPVEQKKKKVSSKPVPNADSPPPLPPAARKRVKKETAPSSPVVNSIRIPKSQPVTEREPKDDSISKKADVDAASKNDKPEKESGKLLLKLRMQPPSDLDVRKKLKTPRPEKQPVAAKIPPSEPRPTSKAAVVKVPLSKPPTSIKIPISRPLRAGASRAKAISPKVPPSGPLPLKREEKDPFGEGELHGYGGHTSAIPESKVLDANDVKEELTTSDALENGVAKPGESVRSREVEKLLEDDEASRLLVFAYERSRFANRNAWVKRAKANRSSVIHKKEEFEKECDGVKAELERFLKWRMEVGKKTSVGKDVLQNREDKLATRISSLKEVMFDLRRVNPGKMANELWTFLDELWNVSPNVHGMLREVLVLWADLMYMFYTPQGLQTGGPNALAELESLVQSRGRNYKEEDKVKVKAERKERGKEEKRRRRFSARKTISSDDEEERRMARVRDDSLTPVKKERGKGEKRRRRSISKRMSSSEDEEDHRPTKEEEEMVTPVKKKRRVKAESEEFETPFKKKRGKEKGDDNDTDISPASAKGKGVISSAEKANARKRRIEDFDVGKFVEQGARALHNKTDGVEWSLEDCRAIVKLLENGIEPRRDEDQEKHYMTLLKVFGKVAHLRKAAGEKDSDDWKELREKFVMLGPNNPRAMRKFILHCLDS